MTEQPKETFSEITQDIKLWLDRHNWAYWAIALGGVVGMILVVVYLAKHRGSEPTKTAATKPQ